MEYLMITAFMLLVAGIIFGFALLSFNTNSNISKANSAAERFVNNAELVASLGDGSTVLFVADIPDGVESLSLYNNTVSMRIDAGNGLSDVVLYTRPNLTPASFVTGKGRRSFSATFLDGNVVVAEIG